MSAENYRAVLLLVRDFNRHTRCDYCRPKLHSAMSSRTHSAFFNRLEK
jgi:hypothetical protein